MFTIDTNGFYLGDTVRDRNNGYTGKLIGFTQWTSGCARATIQAPVGADHKIPEACGCDVTNLELVEAGPNHVNQVETNEIAPERRGAIDVPAAFQPSVSPRR